MWITRDTVLRGNDIVLCANVLVNNDGNAFSYCCAGSRYDVAMTSLNLNTFKDHVSNRHKFCLIVYKNNVIGIKFLEIMALFRVFLHHPSYKLEQIE